MTTLRQQVEEALKNARSPEGGKFPNYFIEMAMVAIAPVLESYAKRCEEAEARETVLRRNLENAYVEAKRIYPEFDWAGFTETSEIIVMALYDKIKIQNDQIASLTHRLEAAEKETKPTIDGIPWYNFLSRVQKKLESAEARVKELEGKYEAKGEPERNG